MSRSAELQQRIERLIETPMLVAALLVIPTIVIEQSDVGDRWDALASVLNWVIWGAFAAEVAIMLAIAPSPRGWLRAHKLELAIVVLTPPFLPALLQALRVARLARLVRLLRLVRVLGTAKLSRRLFSGEGVRYAAFLALLTVMGGGAAFAHVEDAQHLSAWDGLWWALSTATTVGYGDISPVTGAGRTIAVVVMLVGIGFVGLLTAAIAQRFIVAEVEHEVAEEVAQMASGEQDLLRELKELQARLARIEVAVRERRR